MIVEGTPDSVASYPHSYRTVHFTGMGLSVPTADRKKNDG